MFQFVTFVINFVVILSQFVLSILPDKPSARHYILVDNVRELMSHLRLL